MVQLVLKEPSIQRIPPVQTALSNHPQEEKPTTNCSTPVEPMVDDHIIHEDTWESKSHCRVSIFLFDVGLFQPPRLAYQQSIFPGSQSLLGKHQ